MITVRRAGAIAALGATLAYLPALGNGYTLDDTPIVRDNPAAHSVTAALAAFDDAYWPAGHGAGLYRPLVILSFAVDWRISGGSTVWLHATNVAWHAAATALLVPLLSAYVGPAGALAGGLVFGVHPVHVEAVAGLVGRGEPMAAAFIFAAILLARAVRRRRGAGGGTVSLEVSLIVSVALALLSKEHAVVAIALLGLDDVATRQRIGPALPWRTYIGIAALTAGWLVLRRAVEHDASFATVAPAFFQLDEAGRLSTMMPVVFVLLRLLVWPFDVSSDYHPQVVERLTHLTPLGAAGAVVLVGGAVLAFALWRRNRAVAVGLLVIGLAWQPTANLIVPTGVVIAERLLYLPSAGVALLVAAGAAWLARHAGARRTVAAVAVVVVAFGARTATATGDWRSSRDLVLHRLASHPESYRAHQAAARALREMGDVAGALAEYGVAAELYPFEIANLLEAGQVAFEGGNARLGLRYFRQAEALDATVLAVQRSLAYAMLRLDSAGAALRHARRSIALAPRDAESARLLAGAFLAVGEPDSARAVWPAYRSRGGSLFRGWLYSAATFAALAMPDSARLAFDSARAVAPDVPSAREDLRQLLDLLRESGPSAPRLR